MPVQHITTLLEDLKWKATPLPESRRTRGRTATIRVRAEQPPTSMLYRITSGAEAYTVHIEKAEPKPRVPKPTPTEPPETWAEAAKRAMGKSVVEQHGTQSAVPHDFHTPVLPVATQAQDTADQDMGSANEDDTDEEDTDSFDDRFVEAEPLWYRPQHPSAEKGQNASGSQADPAVKSDRSSTTCRFSENRFSWSLHASQCQQQGFLLTYPTTSSS